MRDDLPLVEFQGSAPKEVSVDLVVLYILKVIIKVEGANEKLKAVSLDRSLRQELLLLSLGITDCETEVPIVILAASRGVKFLNFRALVQEVVDVGRGGFYRNSRHIHRSLGKFQLNFPFGSLTEVRNDLDLSVPYQHRAKTFLKRL